MGIKNPADDPYLPVAALPKQAPTSSVRMTPVHLVLIRDRELPR